MLFTIQAASTRSGVSPHVIRIWERRYSALTPKRTGTNRRMYNDDEVERLRLLRVLTESGHRIGNIAAMEVAELEEILSKTVQKTQPAAGILAAGQEAPPLPATENDFTGLCIQAVESYDSARLLWLLQGARLQFGPRGVMQSVLCPFIHRVRQAGEDGQLRAAHEYVALSVLRDFLTAPRSGAPLAASAPEIVVAAPKAGYCEAGAMLAAASARDLGWRVTYLGPDLPEEDLAACARTRRARAIALSVGCPDKCPTTEARLRKVRQLMPESMALIVGGKAAPGYLELIPDLPIFWAYDLSSLDQLLQQLSTAAPPD